MGYNGIPLPAGGGVGVGGVVSRQGARVDGKTVAEWAAIHGISAGAIYSRVSKGWTLAEACKAGRLRLGPPTGPGEVLVGLDALLVAAA